MIVDLLAGVISMLFCWVRFGLVCRFGLILILCCLLRLLTRMSFCLCLV